MRWAAEGNHRRMVALAMPWSLLTDRWFGEGKLTATAAATAAVTAAAAATTAPSEILRSSVTRLVFRLNKHDTGTDRFTSLSPATTWVMDTAGPCIIEPWRAHAPDGALAATATWRQLWAFREIGKATLRADVQWAIGSFALTAALVWINTGSLFLTVGGMSAVAASLAAAHFVYVVGLGVTWVGMLNFLGIFIVLGIGADDIFVILEFWRQSAERAPCIDFSEGDDDVLVSRMQWTIGKSLCVCTMTSLTTAVAFACNLASQIVPIRLFGAFMTTLVVCNCWLVCTTFPALIIMQHRSTRRIGRAIRYLSRGRHVLPGPAGDAKAAPAAAAVAAAADQEDTEDISAQHLVSVDRSMTNIIDLANSLSPVNEGTAKPHSRSASLGHNGVMEVSCVRPVRRELNGTLLDYNINAPFTPTTPPTSCARHHYQRNQAHHRRTRSCMPSSTALSSHMVSEKSPAYTRDTLLLSVPLLQSPPLRTPPSPTTPTTPTTHQRRFSLNLEGECCCRRAQGQQAWPHTSAMTGLDGISFQPAFPRPNETKTLERATAAFEASADQLVGGSSTGMRCIIHIGDDATRTMSWGDIVIRTLANFVIRFRWPIVLAAAFSLAVSIAIARRMQPPPRTDVTLYPDGHNINRFAAASSVFAFSQIEEAVRVRFVWGITQAVPTSKMLWDPENPLEISSSKPVTLASIFEDPNDAAGAAGGLTSEPPAWDPSFDVVSRESQAWMLRFCAALRGSDETAGRLQDARAVDCFMEDVDKQVRRISEGELGLPLPPGQFTSAIGVHGWSEDNHGRVRFLKPRAVGSVSSQPSNDGGRQGEVGAVASSDEADGTGCEGDRGGGGGEGCGGGMKSSDHHIQSSSLSPSEQGELGGDISEGGDGDDDVAAVVIDIALRISRSTSTVDQLAAEEAFWETWFVRQLATAPPGLCRGFQTSPMWVHVATEVGPPVQQA
jgi:hypothetical protein